MEKKYKLCCPIYASRSIVILIICMASLGAPLREFSPKKIKTPERRYHLGEVYRGLTIPDPRLQRHILIFHLDALDIIGQDARLKNDELISTAIKVLTEFGLSIPEAMIVPTDIWAGYESEWLPKPKQKKKPKPLTPEQIQKRIAKLQAQLESP